jgi:hypothetical protein
MNPYRKIKGNPLLGHYKPMASPRHRDMGCRKVLILYNGAHACFFRAFRSGRPGLNNPSKSRTIPAV